MNKLLAWHGLRHRHTNEIEQAVRKVEERTSGEIVPLVVGRSVEAMDTLLPWILNGVVAGLTFIALDAYLHWTPIDATWAIGSVACFGALGAALSFIPLLGRWIVGRDRMDRAVQLRAYAAFMEEGVSKASHRSGVLILISLLEHRVVILGDQGIHEKVPDGFWKEHCQTLGRAIKSRHLGDGLIREIESIGEVLAKHFPKTDDRKSELSNTLRSSEE